ncbi:MAG: ATP-dependent RecD-like DNA helicase, partial [Verrucomicrobiae bacterium]|nr:ATP-dependent RecD-like DNA helicase [Verrucomicrobiae bacterium]
GKEYAHRIVEKFGASIFDVIDQSSQRLEEIEGIGPKRRRRIKESWRRQRAVRGIMVFLHSHGISASRALRIYKTYGEEAVDVLRANPYRLAEEISGIGFKTADEIAAKLGQAADAPARLEAGVIFVLKSAASNQGHCALPLDELIRQASEVMGFGDTDGIAASIDRLVRGEKLIRETVDGQDLVFLEEYHSAEEAIARRVRHFARLPSSYPPIDGERAMEWFEHQANFALGEEQKRAVAEALRNRILVITGGPGVGKTTILKAVLGILEKKDVTPVLCAPTGRAAKRLAESTGLGAGTIHRLLEFQPDGRFGRGPAKRLEGDLFVIDEASMIDVLLMRRLLEAIPDDGHVLLVGDVDQLPSVGPGRVLADLIESGTVPVAGLTEIFRQAAASRIVTTAHAINRGEMPDLAAHEADSDFFFIERPEAEALVETLVEVVGRRLPAKFGLDPLRDIQVLSPMNRNSLGTRNLNTVLQSVLNPPSEFKFEIERFGVIYRAGDKVIQTRNNYEKEVFNGDIGNIREITTDPARILVRYDGGRDVEYEPGELDELQLAYAITIHKSQGSEFPAVVIPVGMQHYLLLQRNLIYTGITRGKRLVVVIGDPKALAMAVNQQESQRRWSTLRHRLQAP